MSGGTHVDVERQERELGILRATIGAVWEALPDSVAGDYDEPYEAVAFVVERCNQRTAHLEQRCSSQDRELSAKIRENAALLARTRENDKQLGDVWESLPDDCIDHTDDPGEAVRDTLALNRRQVADLEQQLAKARQHAADLDRAMEPLMQQTRTIEADISVARVEGYRLGRNSTLDRIEAALGKSSEPESFTRGIVAALRASLTWRDR